MNYNDLLLLKSINEHENISRVSELMYLSQPAISYRLNKIEELFNTQLFIRSNKGIQITPKGHLVIDFAMEYIERFDRLKEAVYTLDNEIQGPLMIGASDAIAQYLLPKYLSDFCTENPKVEVNLKTGFSDKIKDLLLSNKIHIAFSRENIPWEEHKSLISTDGIYLVSDKPISINDLPNMTRIYYQTNPSLRNILDLWWKNNVNTPGKNSIEVDSAEACKELIKSGMGYSFLTGLVIKNETDLSYTQIKGTDGQYLQRETWIYATNQSLKYITSNSFWNYISQQFANN